MNWNFEKIYNESIIKPEPKDVARLLSELRCGCLSKNSLKNSSKGEPGGNFGLWTGLPPRLTNWVVEILTTAGNNFCARSAKDFGGALENALPEIKRKLANIKKENVISLMAILKNAYAAL